MLTCLNFHELNEGSLVQQIGLSEAIVLGSPQSRWIDLATAGSLIAAIVGDQLHLISLAEIDKSLLAEPFRVGMYQTYVIDTTGSTEVSYQLLGGRPPYQLKLTVNGVPYTAANMQTGQVTLQGEEIINGDLMRKVRTALFSRHSEVAVKKRVRDYLGPVTPLFHKVTGRDPKGIPISVQARLEVIDANLRVAEMRHAFIMELPTKKLVKDAEQQARMDRASRQARQRGTQSKQVVPRKSPAARKSELRSAEREKLLRKISADYASVLLRKYPPEKTVSEDLDERAEAALKKIDEKFAEAFDKRKKAVKGGMRDWRDKKGHFTQAALEDVFADQVVLRLAKGGQVTVPREKLSQQDQDIVNSYLKVKENKARPQEYIPAQMDMLLQAITHHGGL